MKKTILLSLCLCIVMASSGCAGTSNNTDDLQKNIDEQKETIAAQATQLDDVNTKLDKLDEVFSSAFGDDSTSIFDDDFNIDNLMGSDIHEIYDDTAVVQAYKSGDDSALTDEKDKFIYDTAKKFVDDNITDKMTDYEKELAVYNYIYSQTNYDDGNLSAIPSTEDYSHTPYGVLHDHTAICVGNATTFKLFMDMLDIDCKIIHSTEEGEHAWDLVCIDDEWYHVDLTFDNGSETQPAYANFNVTDEFKQTEGYPWNADDFPAATATKYNYSVMNSTAIDDIYAIPAKLSKCVDDKKTGFYFNFKMSDTDEVEILDSYVQMITDAIFEQCNTENYYFNTIAGTEVDGTYYGGIAIVFYDNDDGTIDPDSTNSNLDMDKIYSNIADAFS